MSGTALIAPRSHKFSAADGTTLHVTDYFLPAAQARGGIMIMHGLGEHSGRYAHVAQFFNSCGLSVRTYDHRGHGRSDGKRGDVNEGHPIILDAEMLLDDFAAQLQDPPFLLGHSMGGLFACRFALEKRSPLRGLILSSPALLVTLSRAEQLALAFMHRFLPRVGVPNGLKVDKISHDPAVVQAYRDDPLVHGKISARLLASMLNSMEFCRTQAATLSVPTMMVVAGDDHLVQPEGSKRFHAASGAELRLYDGFYHELFNEPGKQQVFDDIRAWLK